MTRTRGSRRPSRFLRPFRIPTALSIAILLAGAGRAAADASLDRGRNLYFEHCAECHGAEGHGDGEKAERLGFHPRDFTLGAFKCRSTPTGSPPTDDDLARVIESGLRGTPMLGFDDDLDDEQLADLVAYVQTLIPNPPGGQPPAVLEVPEPPQPTAESVRAGRAIYRLLGCWKCHGVEGDGDGPAAEELEDQWGEPIDVYDFTRRNRFKCGGTRSGIYRTLHTGMTGSPMPSFTTAFVFGRDQVGGTEPLAEVLGAEAVDESLAWLASQPTGEEIRRLGDAERRDLIDERTWALVDYLRSLAGD